MSTSKVSFTIRRPTPVSRGDSGTDSAPEVTFKVPALPKRLAGSSNGGSPLDSPAPSPRPRRRDYHSAQEKDSSDEEDEEAVELVTGFDQFGVQRLHEKPKAPKGPLVIPALQNKDWRELARKRKALYVPPQAVATGADGSVGGLGTRDSINSGPQLSGLQVNKRVKLEDEESLRSTPPADEGAASEPNAVDGVKREEQTDDARALRAILASAESGDDPNALHIDAIPLAAPTPSEDDVYKQDVEELPESASLEDYERVPVSQFGAALLRGMGWKEGTAASRKNKGPVEPYLPQSRPALLGIGAKEKEVLDDGSKRKKGKGRPERRYVPVVKRERTSGDREDGKSERTRSPSPDRWRDRDAGRGDRDYDKDRDQSRDRDGDSYGREKERDRDRRRGDKEGDRRGGRRDDAYDSSRRDRDRRRDRSPVRYEPDRRRDGDRERRR